MLKNIIFFPKILFVFLSIHNLLNIVTVVVVEPQGKKHYLCIKNKIFK